MPEKVYFSYAQIHKTVKQLSDKVKKSGFKADLIVAIGTGGFIPARILKTFLHLPVLTVGLQLYDEDNQPVEIPEKIQWIDEAEEKIRGKRVLLVDEVDDSRATLSFCTRELLKHGPQEIAVSVLHNKRKEKRSTYPQQITKTFYGREIEDHWIVYPWDAIDIDEHQANAGE